MVKRSRDQDLADTVETAHSSSFNDEQSDVDDISASNGNRTITENASESSKANSSDEDVDDDNESDDDQKLKEPSSKRQKKAPVSAQDVQIARETAELFKSNIFKLQIDELIKELKLKESHSKLIENCLHRLHDIIQQVPKSKEYSLYEAESLFNSKNNKSKHGIVIPFPDPKPVPSFKGKFQYDTPEFIALVGSFGLKTAIQQPKGTSIDVSLTIPREFFQPKDYLNYRAIYKRAFYVAYLVQHLIPLTEKNHFPVKISYEYVNGDILCPAIRIESVTPEHRHNDDLIFEKTRMSIRLLVGFETGLFDAKKLLPDRNCIRVQTGSGNNDNSQLPPTPLYNASILSSSSYTYYLEHLLTARKSADGFRDAAMLGKLWLKQHGFSSHFNEGGFGHFEFTVLMAALLEGGGENGNKILLHGFSSYQLFKATIKYLATQDLCNDGYLSFSFSLDRFATYKQGGFNVPTIFDKYTKINILWKMTVSSYELLKKFAQQTLTLLNDVVQDRFRPIFMMNSDNPLLEYDSLIQIPLNSLDEEGFGALEKISFLTFQNFICSKVHKILNKALGERATEISVSISKKHNNDKWPISKRKPSSSESNELFINIGLFLDSSSCEKKVTKGPLHSDKQEGEKFASFWGSKAQIRKYKDGSIQYSCLWQPSPMESTVTTIIKYILTLHLQKDISDKLIINSNKFIKYLPQPFTSSNNSTQPIILPSHFQDLKNAYNDICKILYDSDLPITLKTILPISSSLRNSSLLLPVPFAVSNEDFFNESILQFESSTKWPDELIALEQTKTAFLLKINEMLNKETAYKSHLVKDDIMTPYNDKITLLRVLTPEGYGFSFRILTERDEILYLRAIENATEKQKKTVTDIYLKFNQKYMGSAKHHRAVSSLVSKFPFYSPVVRLFKRWLDSQLLLCHFPDELAELIALKVFIDPAPFSTPSSVSTGFIRILHFLSVWNWKEDPLILDLSKGFEAGSEKGNYIDKIDDKLTVQSYQVMYNNFNKLRKEDPNANKVQYFIASKEDPSGKLWTSHKVSLPIASRLTALSKASISLLSKEQQQNGAIPGKKLKLIFTPALKDYDFSIKMKIPKDISNSSGILQENKFKNLIQPLTSFPDNLSLLQDPTQSYFDELVGKYNNVMILSTHKFTGLSEDGKSNVITGLFNPGVVNGKKKFRVNIGYNIKPVESENDKVELEFNKEAVLAQVVGLGDDLVTSFEAK